MNIKKEQKKTETALKLFLDGYNIKFDVAYIKDLIYNRDKD